MLRFRSTRSRRHGWTAGSTLVLALPLLLPLFLLGTVSCGSTGGSTSRSAAQGEAGSVIVNDYRRGTTLQIVNDSWLLAKGYEGETHELRRAAYYSALDREGSARVADDAVFDGIEELLRQSGFEDHAARTSALGPDSGAGQTIEIITGRDTRSMALVPGQSADEVRAFMTSLAGLMDVFNLLPKQYLSLEGPVRFETGR